MRNLSLLSSIACTLPAGHDGHAITATAVDVDEDVLFVASESKTGHQVDVLIWTVDTQNQSLRLFADLTSSALDGATVQLVSFMVIAETRTLCAITRSGDIAILPLHPDVGTDVDTDTLQHLDIVGTISPGSILSVALAPDASLLALVTAVPSASLPQSTPTLTLHLLSHTFVSICSLPLSTSHSGEAVPITIGWGSRATQFHGSLGKQAAEVPPLQGSTTTPDDDGVPRISWRGDAQYFVVSTVEGDVPGKRVLRVFNRAAVLQSTAEEVPGLEHPLAWRPSGGLIASTQRFGAVPDDGGLESLHLHAPSDGVSSTRKEALTWSLGNGRVGRHDVVFFERNGLRHGELGLRENPQENTGSSPESYHHPLRSHSCLSEGSTSSSESNVHVIAAHRLRWGYRIRELSWNADSSVLSIWVERDAGDVVQLWITGNYHWYLKLEFPAPAPATHHWRGGGRYTNVMWHPEDPSRLLLSTWETFFVIRHIVSTACSPRDSGLVGVVDGGDLLLTPFRIQNVPPPMASLRLPLALQCSLANAQTPPMHVTFVPYPHQDVSSSMAHNRNHNTVDWNNKLGKDDARHDGSYTHDLLDILVALYASGDIVLYTIQTASCHLTGVKKNVTSTTKGNVILPSVVWRGCVSAGRIRQACVRICGEAWLVGVLGEETGRVDALNIVVLVPSDHSGTSSEANPFDQMTVSWTGNIDLPRPGGRLVEDQHIGEPLESREDAGTDKGQNEPQAAIIWQACDGGLWEVPLSPDKDRLQGLNLKFKARFPEFCTSAIRVTVPLRRSESCVTSLSRFSLFVGLSASTLFVTGCSSESTNSSPVVESILLPHMTLSNACTSYIVAGSYLMWTTTAPAHEAVFAKLNVLCDRLVNGELTVLRDTFEKRRVERGSRIVAAIPGTMSLVLQMPRGNLETVMPRPLVIEQVRTDVDRGNYRAAFLACRKHRVDSNIIVELNPAAFMENIPIFVEQLDDVDHINLFLSGLGRSSLSHRILSELCDIIRVELERRNVKKFVKSILTAHVVKTPPDYEAGLSLLLRLRATDPDLVQDAVKYVMFLADVNKLYDAALGMYDFSLVLLVAQHSQKDPREFLPLLRSLRATEGPYQHFRIDNHLKRYSKALRSLYLAGEEHFEEAKLYVHKHGLYMDALELWKEEPKQYDAMLELYGDHLYERQEFREAAVAFVRSSQTKKAIVAYEKGLEWREVFDLVIQNGITRDKLLDMARRIADELRSKKLHAEAARVFLDYMDNIDEAIASLVSGSEWSEARRVAVLHNRVDLLPSVILPGILEACSSILEEVDDIRDLLDKQIGRLDELTKIKLLEPEIFFGLEEANLPNVDVMTDISALGTTFTRYTVALTSTDRSRRTSRSKRKLDRKAGRKGTVQEEEYLLNSLSKLIVRLEAVQAECRALLPHLVILSDNHVREACHLQSEVEGLESAMRVGIDRIWMEREQPSSAAGDEPAMFHGLTNASKKELMEKVPKPTISNVPWKIGWIKTA